ncbi:hypothetical protein G3N58_32290 [Paraburkholderia sp. Ac-20342]|uniref:hypothetical protein n=1 Tax=Paraburkholderia sp. Ac-20342 TaxID=2703889 RepID=UPI00197E61D5|nr:hypothetical protein [Paraburkholderia sp. Ac-20342]MBN3851459.1 hypothetical protein [Paraburkholderia sp. Ac-20342]
MRNRWAKPPDALARLFLDVTGELPDDASLLRLRRISGALKLRDNDALWSVLAALEYYTRLYEAMPDCIRKAGGDSFGAVRREAGEATDALMHRHRDALARCKATIQLAEDMIREHEARYQAALATLNEASLVALADRMANRVAGIAGNRLVGTAAVAAREQRRRMDDAVGLFEQAVAEAAKRAQAGFEVTERRLTRTLVRLLVVVASLCVMLIAAAFWVGEHAR